MDARRGRENDKKKEREWYDFDAKNIKLDYKENDRIDEGIK